MHLLLNGYFLGRPTTGTGQYTHHLLRQLQELWDGDISVIIPGGEDAERPEGFDRCKFYLADSPLGGGLAKVWFEYSAVSKAVSQLKPDVLHIPYFGPPLGAAAPMVVTVHDLIQLVVPALKGGPLVRFYNQCAIQGAKRATYLLADSEFTKQDMLRELKCPPDRVQTVPLACSEEYRPNPEPGERERLAQRYGLAGDYLLYTGGLDLRKNVSALIRAYAQSGVQTPLAIAGAARSRGRQFPDLAAVAKAAGAADRVQFLGWVEEEDKPGLYRNCLAFVFPSTYEGFGLTPLEAMACGAPVLCSNATSLPEVTGDAALSFAPTDEAALAALLQRIVSEPDLRQQLRQRGLQQATRFSWRATAQATIAAYHRAVALHSEAA
jgi:glycosyltransferase involved in cell wall biosynthesis